ALFIERQWTRRDHQPALQSRLEFRCQHLEFSIPRFKMCRPLERCSALAYPIRNPIHQLLGRDARFSKQLESALRVAEQSGWRLLSDKRNRLVHLSGELF